jgi:hypothetical protein
MGLGPRRRIQTLLTAVRGNLADGLERLAQWLRQPAPPLRGDKATGLARELVRHGFHVPAPTAARPARSRP